MTISQIYGGDIMKKVFSLLLIIAVALSLVGCQTGPATETKMRVGFVTDVGGISDKSFNQTSWEGIEKYAKEVGLVANEDIKFLQSANDSDYIPNLTQFADDQVDLIVAAGFLFADAIQEVANKYPDQKMLIIDVDWCQGDNVQQAVFAENEGSFLVGVVAGLAAKEAGKNKVGFVMGMESATMAKFYAGYEAGVKAVFPECEILYDNANSFISAELGKTLAAKQFGAGAFIVYHAAGATGNGVIQEAAERRSKGEEVWAIGVDTDQYEYGFYDDAKTKSAVLTSMLKRVDVASYNAAKQVGDGTFKGGVVLYDLASDGVGIPADNPNFKNFTTDFKAALDDYIAKIVSGELVVPKVSESGRGNG